MQPCAGLSERWCVMGRKADTCVKRDYATWGQQGAYEVTLTSKAVILSDRVMQVIWFFIVDRLNIEYSLVKPDESSDARYQAGVKMAY